MNDKNDVSNQAVAVLLVLTILVTVVGTWLVLDALAGTAAASPSGGSRDGGETAQLSLTLMKAPVDKSTAQVGLTLTSPPEE